MDHVTLAPSNDVGLNRISIAHGRRCETKSGRKIDRICKKVAEKEFVIGDTLHFGVLHKERKLQHRQSFSIDEHI